MHKDTHGNPWFFPLTVNNKSTKLRLFAFHHAGGNASMFRPWMQYLASSVDIIAVQLPGRGTRFVEPLLHDLKSVVNNLVENFSNYLDKPFIFFGHSVGALISFELVRALRKEKYPLPCHLIVSGTRAPHLPSRRKKIHNLSDSEFVSELVSYNGIPSGLLEDKELLSLLIPVIRADFTISETYTYSDSSPLSCPITAFGGMSDPYLSQKELSCWGAHTNNEFKYIFFKGDHFFLIKESYPEVTRVLNQIILREIEKNSRLSKFG